MRQAITPVIFKLIVLHKCAHGACELLCTFRMPARSRIRKTSRVACGEGSAWSWRCPRCANTNTPGPIAKAFALISTFCESARHSCSQIAW
jgi:hypothetical protein